MEYCKRVGAWRSLVARTVRVGEVPSSNLGAPIFLWPVLRIPAAMPLILSSSGALGEFAAAARAVGLGEWPIAGFSGEGPGRA